MPPTSRPLGLREKSRNFVVLLFEGTQGTAYTASCGYETNYNEGCTLQQYHLTFMNSKFLQEERAGEKPMWNEFFHQPYLLHLRGSSLDVLLEKKVVDYGKDEEIPVCDAPSTTEVP
ncbi:hypothetical protein E2320_004412 [Naja naja]|nr:hypothetical protein E2320_004412 [Naja naja]